MGKNFNYVEEFTGSLGDLFRKPLLVLPYFYIFVISIIYHFFGPSTAIDETAGFAVIAEALTAGIIGYLVIRIIQMFFESGGLASFRMFLEKKRFDASDQLLKGARIYLKYLALNAIKAFIVILPLLIVGFVLYLALQPWIMSGGMDNPNIAILVIGLLLSLLYLVFVILYLIGVLFSDVIVAYGFGPFKALSKSLRFFLDNKKHVFMVILTLIGFYLLLMLSLFIIVAIVAFLLLLLGVGEQAIEFFVALIIGLVTMITQPLIILFLFKAYKFKK